MGFARTFVSRWLAAMAAVAVFSGLALAQGQAGRWVREFVGHYHDLDQAQQVARAINQGHWQGYRNATYETSPHRVTRTYGVYAERFYAEAQPAPQTPQLPPQGKEIVVTGSLTRGDPLNERKKHYKVYTIQLTAGQEYTIDLMSGNGQAGPGKSGQFDTWLRLEDANGTRLAEDDDSGEGYNARIVYRATRTGTYRIVATSYSAGVTGTFTLRVRY